MPASSGFSSALCFSILSAPILSPTHSTRVKDRGMLDKKESNYPSERVGRLEHGRSRRALSDPLALIRHIWELVKVPGSGGGMERGRESARKGEREEGRERGTQSD
jgi:hypothetical protein